MRQWSRAPWISSIQTITGTPAVVAGRDESHATASGRPLRISTKTSVSRRASIAGTSPPFGRLSERAGKLHAVLDICPVAPEPNKPGAQQIPQRPDPARFSGGQRGDHHFCWSGWDLRRNLYYQAVIRRDRRLNRHRLHLISSPTPLTRPGMSRRRDAHASPNPSCRPMLRYSDPQNKRRVTLAGPAFGTSGIPEVGEIGGEAGKPRGPWASLGRAGAAPQRSPISPPRPASCPVKGFRGLSASGGLVPFSPTCGCGFRPTGFLSTLRPGGHPTRRKTRSQRRGGSPHRRWDFPLPPRSAGHPRGSADLARRTLRPVPHPVPTRSPFSAYSPGLRQHVSSACAGGGLVL